MFVVIFLFLIWIVFSKINSNSSFYNCIPTNMKKYFNEELFKKDYNLPETNKGAMNDNKSTIKRSLKEMEATCNNEGKLIGKDGREIILGSVDYSSGGGVGPMDNAPIEIQAERETNQKEAYKIYQDKTKKLQEIYNVISIKGEVFIP
jgi:hypothetical protein